MSKLMLNRVRLLFVAIIVVFILLSTRLAYLQIVRHDYYWYRAEENRYTKLTLVAPRGEIYDRSGKVLVTNRPGFVVSLMDPGDGYDQESITILSEILEIDEDEIYSAIQGQLYMRYLPLNLQKDITFETIAKISEHRWKLKGVNIDVHPIRHYPHGATAAQVLGYLSYAEVSPSTQQAWQEKGYQYQAGELVGQNGLEYNWQPQLRGQDGEQVVETNNVGQIISYLEKKDPQPGHNLYLTLDLELQQAAEEALRYRVELLREEGNEFVGRAAAVVLDPNTGAILAMANYPSYDANTITKEYQKLAQDPSLPLLNSCIQGVYPIGSTYKMITATAGLEEEKIKPNSYFPCGGVVTLVGSTVGCYERTAHGMLNVLDALAKSCNIFFYRTGLAVGIDKLAEYARLFGFGSPTGLQDIPGEVPGLVASRETKAMLRPDEPWYEAETMSAAIGQGDNSITPLQLANYVAMIANGGTHYRPYLVQRMEDYEGNIVQETQPEVLRTVDFSPENLAVVREGMRRVAQAGGTAYVQFYDLPVAVAAKTGSAQVAAEGSGIPAHSLFVGYAPYENPEIVVAVVVEHGGIGATGATPVAREIMEQYFTGTVKEHRR